MDSFNFKNISKRAFGTNEISVFLDLVGIGIKKRKEYEFQIPSKCN